MNKVSIAIATRNEEKNIVDCLESVKWADEIVIFDESSSDRTFELVKKYTKNAFSVKHDPMFHRTKQMAIDKCKGDWILQIDADERISQKLREEILETIEKNGDFYGYKMPRKNEIFGKWMKNTGWYPDYQIKFFKRNHGCYACKSVHEDITIDGEIGVLKNDLIHRHYSSVDEYLTKLIDYTRNDALYLLSKGESVKWSDAIKFPLDEFFKRFFLWEGYKDGLHGLVLSLLQSFSRLVVFARMWEKRGFEKYDGESFKEEVVDLFLAKRKDWYHWFMVIEKDFFKKSILKIRNKINL